METLQLKHLAPYLPYQVKITFYDGRVHWNIMSPNHLQEINNSDVRKFKLILRPLSDLTKEIDSTRIGGESDVTYMDVVEAFDSSGCHINYSDLHKINHIHEYSFGVIQQLIEWHFDVFGLIEKGLAIDMNTI